MSFGYPEAATLFWLLVPLAVLYLLPLPRRKVNIGSLLIWEKAFERKSVKGLDRWLKMLLTLLFQVAVLVLLVLAAGKIYSATKGADAFKKRIVVVDGSASMKVANQGSSQFEIARKILSGLVSRKDSGTEMIVILSLAEPVVACPWTRDPDVLFRCVRDLSPSDGPGDMEKTLAMVSKIADAQTGVDILSDHLEEVAGLDVKLENITFYPCGSESAHENMGIVDFGVRRNHRNKGEFEVMARIRNHSEGAVEIPLEIALGDQVLAQENVRVPAGGDVVKDFAFSDEGGGKVAALLHCEDALKSDNRAFAVLEPLSAGQVFLWSNRQDPFLMTALGVQSHVELFAVNREKMGDSGDFGDPGDILVCSRSVIRNVPPHLNVVLVNPREENNLVKTQGVVRLEPGGVRVKREHVLSDGVDWMNLKVGEAVRVDVPDWAGTIIESADGVPLVLAGVPDGRKVVVFTFSFLDTGFVTDRSFPVLISNILDWMLEAETEKRLPIGGLLAWEKGRFDEITLPDGSQVKMDAGMTVFPAVTQAGFYELEGNQGQQVYYANLLDENETALLSGGPPEGVILGEVSTSEGNRWQWWQLAAFAVIVLLPLEWFLYHYRYID